MSLGARYPHGHSSPNQSVRDALMVALLPRSAFRVTAALQCHRETRGDDQVPVVTCADRKFPYSRHDTYLAHPGSVADGIAHIHLRAIDWGRKEGGSPPQRIYLENAARGCPRTRAHRFGFGLNFAPGVGPVNDCFGTKWRYVCWQTYIAMLLM
jgi:hypothetical protein